MKKTITVLLLIIIVGAGIGYIPMSIENNQYEVNTSKTIKIGWELKDFKKVDEDCLEEPHTNVFLNLNNRRIKIGTYYGYMMTDKDYLEKFDFPSDYLLACMSFYAGAGDQLCVVREGDTLLVQWKPFDEFEDEPSAFQIIKKIKIPKRAKIKINKKYLTL